MGSFGGFLEIFLQALTAGLLVGAIYGLMCVGLGIIFGVLIRPQGFFGRAPEHV